MIGLSLEVLFMKRMSVQNVDNQIALFVFPNGEKRQLIGYTCLHGIKGYVFIFNTRKSRKRNNSAGQLVAMLFKTILGRKAILGH